MWSELAPELLEVVFLYLLADSNPVYVCLKKVCKHWRAVHANLKIRGHIMKTSSIVSNLWKHPKILKTVTLRDTNYYYAAALDLIQNCMRRDIIEDCEAFVNHNRVYIHYFAVQAVMHNRVECVIRHASYLVFDFRSGDIITQHIYHYEIRKLYHLVPKKFHRWSITFPIDAYVLRPQNNNKHLLSWVFAWQKVFETDDQAHADRVVKMLNRVENKNFTHALRRYICRADIVWKYKHTILAIINNFKISCFYNNFDVSDVHKHNKVAWKLYRTQFRGINGIPIHIVMHGTDHREKNWMKNKFATI
jgi:hypothetical protein